MLLFFNSVVMVRLKQRYILFEVLYPPAVNSNSLTEKQVLSFSLSSQNALLALHQSSPMTLNPKTLTNALRRSLKVHYGEFGAGTCGMQLSVKYFSNKTSNGIIRCGRAASRMVVAALALIDRIENILLIIRCTRVSGTIKKCETYSIKSSRALINMLTKNCLDQELARFKNQYEDLATTNVIHLNDSDEASELES